MNFLQLANRLIEKAGISGGDLTTTVGQTGESRRVVNWINEAYLQIQEMHPNWLWMEADFSFPTATGKAGYTPAEAGIAGFASWLPNTCRSRQTSIGVAGEQFMGVLDYPYYRDFYQFGNTQNTTGQPLVVSVSPDKKLLIGPKPSAVGYTITGKYYRAPSELLLDADVPLLPARFHMIIVYEAMRSGGLYDAATEVIAEGERQYRRMESSLETDQLPQHGLPGCPLV